MENNRYTDAALKLIENLRNQCVSHNNETIMPAHLLLELSAAGTHSAELMERVVGTDRLADLRAALDNSLY